ncbi:hypothetical protein HYPSUDRAFT_47444 [Hypholoma sublateritium FD-334 SS-4]|uniref:Secreted protein n=1 Tax=Hypholoma sublateritium (strain FD-334 SS-4) TaxID=945553 RepID=A0A0D2KP04_HYPSF|nr:hypothetical protein HYPSUDRAFT_47444 [Hypholoma sublateritium FD-334 SS-4]
MHLRSPSSWIAWLLCSLWLWFECVSCCEPGRGRAALLGDGGTTRTKGSDVDRAVGGISRWRMFRDAREEMGRFYLNCICKILDLL